jgi:hypothetical protein
MADDLSAAVERMRRLRQLEAEGYNVFEATAEVYGPVPQMEHWPQDDERAVFDAYLAETDPTPVDEAWLRAAGWTEVPASGSHGGNRWELTVCVQPHDGDGETRHWLAIHEPQTGADGSVWWAINFWQQHTSDEKPDGVAMLSWVGHTTRGHVRRLCAALGVPLREGGAA